MAKAEEKLDQQIAMRVSGEDVARIDALAARVPIATRNAIARAALRFGLEVLEENPGRLISEQPPPKRGGRRGTR